MYPYVLDWIITRECEFSKDDRDKVSAMGVDESGEQEDQAEGYPDEKATQMGDHGDSGTVERVKVCGIERIP